MVKRILVTGSRDWTDVRCIATALRDAYREFDRDAVLVHGDCKKGADKIANDVWEAKVGADKIEKYPAQWNVNGKRDLSAGFKRNQAMIDSKPDLVLAFQTECKKTSCHEDMFHYSHGAQHTIDAAEKAGIPVRLFQDPPF